MQKEKKEALEARKAAEKNAPEGRAYLKYVRISPRKMKIVLDLIRGKDTDMALAILKNTRRAASEYLIKLLNSAVANAEHKNAEKGLGMDTASLYVAECFVCPGPTASTREPATSPWLFPRKTERRRFAFMGQKVNPHGLRVGVIKNWDSRWYVKDEEIGDTIVSDYKIRKYLKEKLQAAGVPKVEIERDRARVRVFIHCAKPGMVIGRGGVEIEKLKTELEAMVGKPVAVNVFEIKNPDLNAQLVAENIASQLERRTSFRRAMKQAIGRTMKLGAKGVKVSCGGRLGGAEIARTEHYHEGTIPLQTLRADIEYGFWEANTTYGKIGVKVWIYRGEVLSENAGAAERRTEERRDRRPRRNDGNRRDGDRRFGNNAGPRSGGERRFGRNAGGRNFNKSNEGGN